MRGTHKNSLRSSHNTSYQTARNAARCFISASQAAPKAHPTSFRNKGLEKFFYHDDLSKIIPDHAPRLAQLESLGYRVTATQSSLEALELFQNDPARFDLAITDQTMPHMTGDTLAVKLMEIKPDAPVILCTGYSEKISEEKAKELVIKAFVLKPINRQEIAETIRRVLDN